MRIIRDAYDETGLSHFRSLNAAVPRTDAVWVLHAGAVRGDGGVWGDGVPCCLIGTKVRPATHEDTPWPQGQQRDIL